jgi:hypothetical protein
MQKNSTSPSCDFLCTFAVLSLVYISPRETLELADNVHVKKKLYQSDVDCCEIPLRCDECCLSVYERRVIQTCRRYVCQLSLTKLLKVTLQQATKGLDGE